jgi:hypothetical protein
MSYFDKYLKYKTKYLALKDTVGGSSNKIPLKPLDDKKLHELWKMRENEKNFIFEVNYPGLSNFFSQYCWISPPTDSDGFDYGFGFFLYKVKTLNMNRMDIKNGIKNNFGYDTYFYLKEGDEACYAVWKIKIENIGPITESNTLPLIYETFKTSVKLTTEEGNILLVGTSYGWCHDLNRWIYQTNNKYYQAYLNGFNYEEIDKIWKKSIKFDVTYDKLSQLFSRYCWVGPPTKAFGIGFFLYEIKEKSIVPDDKYTVIKEGIRPAYALWHIELTNISPIKLDLDVSSIQNSKTKGTEFKTSIPLKSENGDTLIQKTPYYWDHALNRWIYNANNKFYSAQLIVPK